MNRPIVKFDYRWRTWYWKHERCVFEDGAWFLVRSRDFDTLVEAHDAALKHLEMEHPDE